MKAFIVFVVALISVASVPDGIDGAKHDGETDYYWREYDGKVPQDAVIVAQLTSFVPLYIGQGYLPGVGLLPGMIKAGVKELNVAANGRIYTIKDNIMILASSSSNAHKKFQWITVNYQNLESLGELHFLDLVKGGTEDNSTVYIGRYSDAQYTNIGKIYTIEPYQGLAIADSQGKFTIYKNFAVLVALSCDCDEKEPRYDSEEFNVDTLNWLKNSMQSRPLGSSRRIKSRLNRESTVGRW